MIKIVKPLLLCACWLPLFFILTSCGGGSGGGDNVDPNDIKAPQILTTSPSHNSTGVEPNRVITVTFNEDIKPGTINDRTFLVTGVDGTSIEYDADRKTAIFDGVLVSGTNYSATITTGVEDLSGNRLAADYVWTFTTGTVGDSTSPSVRFTRPANSASGVSLNSAFSATFSESIDPVTINTQNISLRQAGGATVAGTLNVVGGTTATFRPAADLSANTQYTATISTGVEDLAGNPMAASHVWTFTTGTVGDSTAPWVVSVSPPDGTENVPLNAVIIVTYNEPITPFEFGLVEDRPVTATFNNDYTIVTLTPTTPLLPDKVYNGRVKSKDLAGNEMPKAYVWETKTVP